MYLYEGIIAFILTEDMCQPMHRIDKWMQLMVLLPLICWVVDVHLMQYRDKTEACEQKKEVQPM